MWRSIIRSSPMDEDIDLIRENPAAVRARRTTLLSTEPRWAAARYMPSTELQNMFETLGFSKDERTRFGRRGVSYGAPPHADSHGLEGLQC